MRPGSELFRLPLIEGSLQNPLVARSHTPHFISKHQQVSNFQRIEQPDPEGIPLLSVFFPFLDSHFTSLNVYLICFNACSLEPGSTSSLLYTFI